MRVAICLSGQLRQWEAAMHNQLWFWSTLSLDNLEIDYFIHTWTYSWDREGVSLPYEERSVTEEEFEKLKEFYKPKYAKIDNKRQPYFLNNDHWSSLFYSLAESIQLKRKYELENNFEYDLVVKSRPDVVFHPKDSAHIHLASVQDGRLFTTHGGRMDMEFNMFNFNDCVFYGNSFTMDLLVNLYFYRQLLINPRVTKNYNVHPLGPGTLMHEFFRDYGITPHFDSKWKETLIKAGCPEGLNLFDVEDFTKMREYFLEWYTK